MHRDAIDNLGAAERLPPLGDPSAEILPLDAQPQASTREDAGGSLPSARAARETRETRTARTTHPASVLTPAVERVLAWHQRRAM